MMAYYIIFDWKSISEQISHILDAISGVLLGLVLAYILMPLMEGIERNILKPLYKKRGYDVSLGKNANVKKRSQMRKIAILITMIFFLIMVYALFRIVLPQIISSVREIANNLPVYIKNIDEYSNLFLANNPELQQVIDASLDTYYATLSSFLTKNLIPLLPNVNTMVKIASQSFISIIKVIIDLIVGFIVAIYVLNSKERFSTRGKKMAYAMFKEENANELISGFRYVNYTFEGFIGGKMVDSLIIGIICYIGCMLLGISYPVLISVIVGVTNIIPFFGPYIGGGAGALILVLIDPVKALIFGIFVIILQQFDGNILGPTILGNSTGLSSFWVIFAISLFGGIWGVVGWLVGVPVFAVFYAFVSRTTNVLLLKKGLNTDTEEYLDLAYIEDGEYKLLTDKSNTKHNSRKSMSTFKKIFTGKRSNISNKQKNNKS
jgi:predicted PurR-regulated permease PerM